MYGRSASACGRPLMGWKSPPVSLRSSAGDDPFLRVSPVENSLWLCFDGDFLWGNQAVQLGSWLNCACLRQRAVQLDLWWRSLILLARLTKRSPPRRSISTEISGPSCRITVSSVMAPMNRPAVLSCVWTFASPLSDAEPSIRHRLRTVMC